MKTIVVGDIHGRTCWKQIANQEFDKFIFVGDYLDTHENITGEEQLVNFEDILQFKRDNKEKVILLIGNHDFHYMPFAMEHYSGFQSGYQWVFKDILEQALKEDLLQIAHQQGKYLFTHAGVSKTWLNSTMSIGLKENVDEHINDIFLHQPSKYFRFNGINPYGDDITQSPIWIREKSLSKDKLDNLIQIVGHTTKSNLRQKGRWISNHDGFKVEDENIWMIDTLGTSGEYLVITDNKITIEKL